MHNIRWITHRECSFADIEEAPTNLFNVKNSCFEATQTERKDKHDTKSTGKKKHSWKSTHETLWTRVSNMFWKSFFCCSFSIFFFFWLLLSNNFASFWITFLFQCMFFELRSFHLLLFFFYSLIPSRHT